MNKDHALLSLSPFVLGRVFPYGCVLPCVLQFRNIYTRPFFSCVLGNLTNKAVLEFYFVLLESFLWVLNHTAEPDISMFRFAFFCKRSCHMYGMCFSVAQLEELYKKNRED